MSNCCNTSGRCGHRVPADIEEIMHPSLIRPVVPPSIPGVVPESDKEPGSPVMAGSPLSRNVSMTMAPETRAQAIEERLSRTMSVPKAMHSLTKLYRTGPGPSSSHTMGPTRAAERFKKRNPTCKHFVVTLYGSLALTGRGHLTDRAIINTLKPAETRIVWDYVKVWERHTNAMKFQALDGPDGRVVDEYMAYSVGGGAIVDDTSRGGAPNTPEGEVYEVYPVHSMHEVLQWTQKEGKPMWQFVYENEGASIDGFLRGVWGTMKDSINRGLFATGVLPGGLNLRRRANAMYLKSRRMQPVFARNIRLFSYALAVSEENANSGIVVTAPTCGACGVVPAVLRWTAEMMDNTEDEVVHALAVAGLFGNIAKTNASISGAEVGCQGEVGVACAMAAAACTQLMGGSPAQIEHAAEMALEHHLGLNCCPVEGLVQIPCIDRNAHAATRAVDCAEFALAMDGNHMISYDEVVLAMKLSGLDMSAEYKETSLGGLSVTYNLDEQQERARQEKEAARVKNMEETIAVLHEKLRSISPAAAEELHTPSPKP